ncbi:MAG: ActS/PrrB/RegB family redox-sensitive histidine kinase [Rhodobacteraceae bacterium]|nr:ActS/PrrB/RegB family redox-sensitive histidine kinase [Paracoccaceae bacterium]
MEQPQLSIFDGSARSDWVRVRTLIVLRWLAIAGQTIAVFVCVYYLELDLRVDLCMLAIGASVMFNLIATFVSPESKRLSQRQAILTLLFDLGQLVFLLYLNGGLNNPFVLLILAPVTVSATALKRDATFMVAGVAMAAITLLLFYYQPLHTMSGRSMQLPELYLVGKWAALVIGILFLSIYARRVTVETFTMSQALVATQMAMAREHELSMLGGVVAAAAHEMGTPLATIKLAASELEYDLKQQPELQQDVQLIGDQTDRLRQILRDMGQAGKEDMLIKKIPLTSLVRSAGEPHENRGKEIIYLANGEDDFAVLDDIPFVENSLEIIHGIRNLIQNAVDFSTTTVWVQSVWTDKSIRILIGDNGKGYPVELLGRIGEPYLGKRKSGTKKGGSRDGYEGMGLGLFIAKTMLERTGAQLTFANAAMDGYINVGQHRYLRSMVGVTGAVVNVRWERPQIERARGGAIDPNPQVE